MAQKSKKKSAAKKAKDSVKKLEWHEEPKWQLVIAIAASAGAYGFGSWAIDSGSLWHYLVSFVALYYAAAYLKRFIKAQLKNNNGSKAAKAKAAR